MAGEFECASVLAPYIEGHIKERRALGFKYDKEEKILVRFDRYCTEKGLDTPTITKPFLEDWCTRTKTEGLCNQSNRIHAVRMLALYMASLGMDVYIPKFTGRRETVLPHILTAEETAAFFHEVDSYYESSAVQRPENKRLANEYRVIFRMIYCCGLRNAEGCTITPDRIDLKKGTLDIMDSKGKDRRVYMADDLTALCKRYYEYLCDTLHMRPDWFFPAKNPKVSLRNSRMDYVFNACWGRTSFAATCNNKPTVHDLRFSFVTDRINKWSSEGENLDSMMPYLEKYLGHKSLQDSYYYYHNTADLYDSIRERDRTADLYIPEAPNYE